MSEDNKIKIKGKFANTLIWMDENLEFRGRNLMFENLPEMNCTDTMTVPFMAGLIENLKKENALNFPIDFQADGKKLRNLP